MPSTITPSNHVLGIPAIDSALSPDILDTHQGKHVVRSGPIATPSHPAFLTRSSNESWHACLSFGIAA